MSKVTQRVRDFLTKSPSVVYPDDVLELFEQVECENTKLRELVKYALLYCERGWPCEKCPLCGERETKCYENGREITSPICKARDIARDLGIEEDAYDE